MTTKNLNNSENSELGFDNIFFSDMSESSDTIDSGEIKGSLLLLPVGMHW